MTDFKTKASSNSVPESLQERAFAKHSNQRASQQSHENIYINKKKKKKKVSSPTKLKLELLSWENIRGSGTRMRQLTHSFISKFQVSQFVLYTNLICGC